MRMLMSFENQSVFYGLRSRSGFQLSQSGIIGGVIFLIIAALPNIAVAQFPGVGSEAPSGIATNAGDNVTNNDDVSSDAAYADNSISYADSSDIVGNPSNNGSDFSNQKNDDGGVFDRRSSDRDISTSNLKKKHNRKQLFINRLRLEFAAIELIERKTGLPFSRGEVPRYLDELRGDLKTMVARAENGEITEGALKSIARDVNVIETHLNEHLDQLLEKTGYSIPKKPFFTITPTLPKPNQISIAGIDSLYLKFELAKYGEKVLQAMGAQGF